ncbi:hypothetical protein DY000_02058049 [Brassica cretica]|uniref:ACB domain-containing protein n=1 Tax=Brassica cretica TaxID=69181 RepID=A0ABQ7ALC1_BRACR|nr:hypothetical protein DY000_02058049 [Brassica cretica]
MSQEEAMEQYLALVSKETPGLINIGHTDYSYKRQAQGKGDPSVLSRNGLKDRREYKGRYSFA